MSGTRVRQSIAAVFFVLGGWALIHPWSVIDLCLLPEFRGPGMAFAVGCFGAQALIAGLFAATAHFTPTTFKSYALMLGGFLAFDAWFTLVDPVLTLLGGGLDAAGNFIMMLLCRFGLRDSAMTNR